MIVLGLLMIMSQPAAPLQGDTVFYVATYVDVEPSSTNQAITLIQQYREASRAEGGNSGIDVVQEIGRPNRFVIMEVWKDQSSFEAHENGAHTAQFRARLQAIHDSPYDQRVHHALAADPRPIAAGRDMVSVVTHVDVPPQRREEAEALLKGVAEESRKHEGNARYDVFQQNAPRTNHFTVFAAWRDRNAFDSHEMKPHTRQFREALGPILGAPYDDRLYKPLTQP